MWESRHGFPTPARLPGGHRRYSDRDAEQVREVARLRHEGLSMPAAIERVLSAARPVPASVFAGLRELHPEVVPAILPKRAVLGLTHALEDEYCARAARGVVIGSFQRERFYRRAERRWTELARTGGLVIAVADFEQLSELDGRAIEVPIASDQAMAREWTLVIDAPGSPACLAAFEHPSQDELADGERRFEVLWSFEPAVVRSASQVATEVLQRFAPAIAARIPDTLGPTGTALTPELRFASSLTHRMVGYLGAILDSPSRAI
jgi:MerR family transcriptional regulator, light-induced transcriptional regulator